LIDVHSYRVIMKVSMVRYGGFAVLQNQRKGMHGVYWDQNDPQAD